MDRLNELGQPIGVDLDGWEPPEPVAHVSLVGHHVSLEPLQLNDAAPLFESFAGAPDELWTYMGFNRWDSVDELKAVLASLVALPTWQLYTIEKQGRPVGFAAYLRVQPGDGVLEIGSIMFSPPLQRTTAATEAIYLMIKHAFDAGYRRVEWKCDSLNFPSRVAGQRLGFRYEGTFVSATHYKGRNRDTAWFAITVDGWTQIRRALELWMAPSNFDSSGNQIRSLASLRD